MHCDPESRYSYGDALLHEACRTNRTDIVRFLLSSGRADPWTKNVTNQTPLQCCSDYEVSSLFADLGGQIQPQLGI